MRTPKAIAKHAFEPIDLLHASWRSFAASWRDRVLVLGMLWGVGICAILIMFAASRI